MSIPPVLRPLSLPPWRGASRSRPWRADTWEQLFNRIFLTRIEPRIATEPSGGGGRLPGAHPDPGGHRRATACTRSAGSCTSAGVEVANCFQEETDRAALGKLLASEARHQRTARVVPRPDLALAEAFGSVAACSGVAVGIDRLYALLLGLPAIAPVMACADSG